MRDESPAIAHEAGRLPTAFSPKSGVAPCTSATHVNRPFGSQPKICGRTTSAAPHGTSF
jgi:hypothetical protein